MWSEAVVQGRSIEKVLLKISQNSLEKTSVRVCFLIKLQNEAYIFIKKETLAQVPSCEFCLILIKSSFFHGASLVAYSEWLQWD